MRYERVVPGIRISGYLGTRGYPVFFILDQSNAYPHVRTPNPMWTSAVTRRRCRRCRRPVHQHRRRRRRSAQHRRRRRRRRPRRSLPPQPPHLGQQRCVLHLAGVPTGPRGTRSSFAWPTHALIISVVTENALPKGLQHAPVELVILQHEARQRRIGLEGFLQRRDVGDAVSPQVERRQRLVGLEPLTQRRNVDDAVLQQVERRQRLIGLETIAQRRNVENAVLPQD